MRREVAKKIKNKIILITGGTGSFGNSVIEKLISLGPKKIIIFSRDEKIRRIVLRFIPNLFCR